jgi:signal transduction histidine kinase/HAMP domain-containing protein
MKLLPFHHSLQFRLGAGQAALLVAIAAVLLVLLPSRMGSQSQRLVQERATDIANLLGSALAPAIDFDNDERAKERLDELSAVSDAVFAGVYRSDGSLMAAFRPEALPSVGADLTPQIEVRDGLLMVAVPITGRADVVGKLVIGFSLGTLDRERRDALTTVALATALIVIVGFLLGVTLTSLVIRPISRVTELARRISAGELPSSAGLARGGLDEVGRMSEAVAGMLDQLRWQTMLLKSRSEASSEGTLLVSKDGQVASHTQRFLEMWGLDRDLTGISTAELVASIEPRLINKRGATEMMQHVNDSAQADSPRELELTDGRVFEVYDAVVRSVDGEHFGRAWYFREITDRKHAEETVRLFNLELEARVQTRTSELEQVNRRLNDSLSDLRRAQEELMRSSRLTAVGAIAAQTAHEVLNPVTSIHGRLTKLESDSLAARASVETYSTILAAWSTAYARGGIDGLVATLREPAQDGKRLADEDLANLQAFEQLQRQREDYLATSFQFLLREVNRITRIVDGMRNLSRQQGTPTVVAVDDVLREAGEILGDGLHKRGIALSVQVERACAVRADRYELLQVLTNLMRNAMQAIEEKSGRAGGAISLTASTSGEQVHVRITDSGAGMRLEHMPLLFESNFSTRSNAEGTGLGLSISRRLARGAGGDLAVESTRHGAGTTMLLTLRRCPPVTVVPVTQERSDG